jgi:3-deoxy-7-phosphoheptulonate synthase
MPTWSPSSWKNYPAKQQPVYPQPERLQETLAQLREYPPLVYSGEIEHLKRLLAEAAQGKRFVLQGGDCAERFRDCTNQAIVGKLKILLQMSLVLIYGLRKPVVRIGRIAGQFAKPRSAEFETVAGQTLPVYRGDLINSFEPIAETRTPDPRRLLQSYYHSSLTMNYVRALIEGGFADLHHPEHWNLEFISASAHRREYVQLVERLTDAIHFMESLGGLRDSVLGKVNFFTSHEGLLLCYEEALTRRESASDKYYNAGAHTLWIGDRTRDLSGAHVEYFRGLANPLGLKIGPSCSPEELLALLRVLNPLNEWGRITLITRLGQQHITRLLPPLLQAVQKQGAHVLWCCDPMHGNTTITEHGVKTRDFEEILAELRLCFELHRTHGSWLGGVHFELTGENVTECTGGAQKIAAKDLSVNYDTYCDPRLNYAQSLEMAFQIAQAGGAW